jgi:hypothetical protein
MLGLNRGSRNNKNEKLLFKNHGQRIAEADGIGNTRTVTIA